MAAPKVPYNPKQVTAFTAAEAATLSQSKQVLGGPANPLDSTGKMFDANSNTGLSASFLGDTAQSLEALNATLTDRIEAGRATAESGIRNDAAIAREEIQANQAEGQRQISYAQERLGGSVILRRNVEDFTAGVKKFTGEIDRSLERLDIEMNNALATNNNNAWNQMFNMKKEAIQNQLAMYDRAMDFYYKNAQLALAQHESANKDLDTMLQYATLDDLSPEELQKVSDETGMSIPTLQALGAQAQRNVNAANAAKAGTNQSYPALLGSYKDRIDKYLVAHPGDIAGAIDDAQVQAANVSFDLSRADIAQLTEYAQAELAKAEAGLPTGDAAGGGSQNKSSVGKGNKPGGTTVNGVFINPKYNMEATGDEDTVNALSDALFGRYNTK